MTEGNILHNYGCSCCYNRTPVLGINTIWDTDPWMIPYVGEECAKTHTHRSTYKLYPVCPICNKKRNKLIKIDDIYNNQGIGCNCSDGIKYPNKFMADVLTQLQIAFQDEYSPKWISPKRYDFYVPSMNLIIEMDGGLGHGNKVHSKENKTIEESLEIDAYKDRLAKEHGIEVIRIDCFYNGVEHRFKHIKQNTINKLSNRLCLSQIDWNECNEFACSNLIKVACEYKKNNPNITTTEISEIIGYSSVTICTWLKIGEKLGWCKYNIKEERSKRSSKLGKMNGKPVEVFKDDISFGRFESVMELDRRSEELFGVHFNYKSISSVCIGKRKQYKDYTFKYVD